MRPNPFSPSFGTPADAFFGREEFLQRYEEALETPNSSFRYIFLTGTRGIGKTSLLSRYSELARSKYWDTINTSSINALEVIAHYVGLSKDVTSSVELSPSIRIPAVFEASLGELSKTVRESTRPHELLSFELQKKIKSFTTKQGLAIFIDEAQKISRYDIALISNAVQEAKNAGLPISFVLAGLPRGYSKLRGYADCTFIKRMEHEQLWVMPKSETFQCLRSLFARAPEISLTQQQMSEIARFSGGHPYLIHLIGSMIYRNVKSFYDPRLDMTITVDNGIIESAKDEALAIFCDNVLSDILEGSHQKTRSYIEFASKHAEESGLVKISNINDEFNQNARQMSSTRKAALDTQVLRNVNKYGYLKFALPHFEYIFEPFESVNVDYDEDDEW